MKCCFFFFSHGTETLIVKNRLRQSAELKPNGPRYMIMSKMLSSVQISSFPTLNMVFYVALPFISSMGYKQSPFLKNNSIAGIIENRAGIVLVYPKVNILALRIYKSMDETVKMPDQAGQLSLNGLTLQCFLHICSYNHAKIPSKELYSSE